jgi:hypothetical protein
MTQHAQSRTLKVSYRAFALASKPTQRTKTFFSRSVLSPPRRALDISARSVSYALNFALDSAALRTGSASSATVVVEVLVRDCFVVDTDGGRVHLRPFSSPSSLSSPSPFCRQHRRLHNFDKRRKKNKQRDCESRIQRSTTRNKYLHPLQLHRLRRRHHRQSQHELSMSMRACAQSLMLKTAYVWARH